MDTKDATNTSKPLANHWRSWATYLFAAATIMALIGISYAPFAIFDGFKFSTPTEYFTYAAFISSISTSAALIWGIYNSTLLKKQIEIQSKELELQRIVSSQTAMATISQFYIMYFDEFERSLDRIANELAKTLGIDTTEPNRKLLSGQRDAHIIFLTNQEYLIERVQQGLNSTISDILLNWMQKYVTVYAKLSRITDQDGLQLEHNNSSSIFDVFEAANPAAQLFQTFSFIISERAKLSGLYEETAEESAHDE